MGNDARPRTKPWLTPASMVLSRKQEHSQVPGHRLGKARRHASGLGILCGLGTNLSSALENSWILSTLRAMWLEVQPDMREVF